MALLKQKWLYDINEFKDSNNHKVHVDTICISDVEDPDIYLAEPLYKWQQTEKGKWIMKHSNPTPSYHQQIDYTVYGYKYHICAYLNEKDLIVYKLKFL